ncbi:MULTISPECIES: C40 family peptidase [unclassified Streptomyces]|uniref:C40 family peptidase n=1 Tax=unclassified Streptomyces TaxID=2593676 RepID=UPI000B841790|nr:MULTISPECIES: C40 family peptidase [unclassified Streptomyces]MYZ34147.1 glycoside hydrolase [Streptomyces sp. SID4917]
MSHTAHIPSHRKPRRGASKVAIRAGVAGGVLSTIAVAGAAGPANAAEPVTETIEMPTLTSGLAGAVAQSADATQRAALNFELSAQENAAAVKAAQAARKAKAEAERKAEAQRAEAKKKAEAAARAKAEATARASRTAERTTLAPTSTSSDSGSSSSSGTASAPKATTKASGSAGALIAFAQAQLGDAYVMGSTGPNAWDCSGLVQAAYRQIGVDLPRVSQDQSTAGTQVSLSNLQPGDILYWGGAGSAYHTAIYIGGGEFIGAQNPSSGVVQKSLDWDPPSGAVRVL